MQKHPKFITFEGIEGSGKSTQSKKLYQFFLDRKIDTILTREPGGVLAAEKMREILLDDKLPKLTAETELLLNFAARIEHVNQLIKPALETNKTVICDRFFDSTFAYQGSAFGVAENKINEIRKIAIQDFSPEITFLIDLPVDIAFKRIEGREGNNRYEQLGFDFHQKVRDGFLNLAAKNKRIKIINGTKNQDEIFAEIIKHFEN